MLKKIFLLAALLLSVLAAFVAPVQAGPFENANAYLGNKYNVPFKLDPAEFGPNNFVRFFHLGAEIVVEQIVGGIVVYTPADPGDPGSPMVAAVFAYGGSGYTLPDQTESSMTLCGPGHWHISDVGGVPTCVAASLVGNEGGYSLVSPEIPAVAATPPCTFQVDVPGAHEHNCAAN